MAPLRDLKGRDVAFILAEWLYASAYHLGLLAAGTLMVIGIVELFEDGLLRSLFALMVVGVFTVVAALVVVALVYGMYKQRRGEQ